jgi:hypothetical protein
MSDILSEGECRAVALARFLTDVDTAGGAAMVLDDPVSSLDHGYRSRAAARLAKAAVDRQVIVFTHDLAFVEALYSSAKACGAAVSAMEVESNALGAGVCLTGIQNLGAGLKTRLPLITASIEADRHLFVSGDVPAWAAKATRIASQLRAAWERGVEEALLNETVTRFERPVQTTRLRVVTVEDSDWETINRAMTQLSRWIDAHDEPAAVGDPPPTPDDLIANVNELTVWKKAVEKRRPLTEQRRPR